MRVIQYALRYPPHVVIAVAVKQDDAFWLENPAIGQAPQRETDEQYQGKIHKCFSAARGHVSSIIIACIDCCKPKNRAPRENQLMRGRLEPRRAACLCRDLLDMAVWEG